MKTITTKLLNSFTFWATEEEAMAYVKSKHWRKYVLSPNADRTCWTLYHKAK